MKKETIEANDLKFREKLPELRSNLASRRKKIQIKDNLGIVTMLVIALLVVSGVVYHWTGRTVSKHQQVSEAIADNQETEKSTQPEVIDQADASQAAAEQREAKDSAAGDTPPVESKETPQNITALVSESKGGDLSSEVETHSPGPSASFLSKSSSSLQPPQAQATRDHYSATSDSDPVFSENNRQSTTDVAVASKTPEKSTATEPPVSLPASAPPNRSRLSRSLTCAGIKDRECLHSQSVFKLEANTVPHVWMEVHSEFVPYVLKHVYYHEGRKYCEVPLKITYPRMRTWSNITLKSPKYAGNWRVEIVSNSGRVLKEINFRVEN
jgi:hypothetical protein